MANTHTHSSVAMNDDEYYMRVSSDIRTRIISQLKPYIQRDIIKVDLVPPFLATVYLNREEQFRHLKEKVCHFELKVKSGAPSVQSKDIWVTFEADGGGLRYTCFDLEAGLDVLKSRLDTVLA